MEPLLFNPTYISPVWGGTRICDARHLAYGSKVNNGEAFDVTAHPGTEVSVANGELAGMRLSEAIAAHRSEILGRVPASDDAVLQVITMDARENLSVQVHPGEAYARAAEGDHGKVEAWYILAADEGASLIAGCSTDDISALRAAAADDSIGDRYCERVTPEVGDFVLIPTGTLHALGAGIFAVEIGSFGNTTYRVCDWGRGRELHVSKSFDVLDTSAKPQVTHLGAFDPATGNRERLGVDAGFYKSFVADVATEMHFSCDGRYAELTCVAGEARVSTADGEVTLGYTESCLVPACAGEFTVSGPCRILRSIRTDDL